MLRTLFRAKPISQLCVEKGYGSNVVMEKQCFRGAKALDSMVDRFSFLSSDIPNDIFLDLWEKQKSKQGQKTLTFAQVVSDVWNPVVEQCTQLLDRLYDRSISLEEVDSLLERYKSRVDLKRHLIHLHKGVCGVKGDPTPTNGDWIVACVYRMEQYYSLKTHAEAASFFASFKSRLGLRGDFSVVENLSGKVL